MIPLLKKGDPTIPDNYRGIALLSTITKIYNKLIFNRIYDEVNIKLRPKPKRF
jgi:hypothetical protein